MRKFSAPSIVTNPAVSIIIPAYNASEYIQETISSVLNQSFQDFEVIVVDDGSTDGTVEMVEKFHDHIQLIRRSNGGAAKARNAGIEAARGEWIAFIDADDIWMPDKLELQLEQASSEFQMVYTDRSNIGTLDGLPKIQSLIQPLYEGDIFLDLLLKGNFITTSSVLIRTGVCNELGGFSEEKNFTAEDWDLWLRVAARYKIGACKKPLVQYRLHAKGVSRNPLRMNRARVLVISRALNSGRANQLSPMLRRQIWARTWATNGWDAARHGKRLAAFTAYSKSLFYFPFEKEAYTGLARLGLS
jgi:glycosyltransferase involved in cell wall biosynthesis